MPTWYVEVERDFPMQQTTQTLVSRKLYFLRNVRQIIMCVCGGDGTSSIKLDVDVKLTHIAEGRLSSCCGNPLYPRDVLLCDAGLSSNPPMSTLDDPSLNADPGATIEPMTMPPDIAGDP